MNRLQRQQNFSSLLRRIFTHWVIFFLTTAVAFLAVNTLLGDPSKSFAERLQSEMMGASVLVFTFLALFPAFMLDTIRFSNRFVGPVSRLRQELRRLAQTHQANDLLFRENDFWRDFANEFNSVSHTIRKQQQQIVELQSKLTATAESVT
jgi:hypothetical protein